MGVPGTSWILVVIKVSCIQLELSEPELRLAVHVFVVFANYPGSITNRSQVPVVLITDLGQDDASVYQENHPDTGERDHADNRCSGLR